MGVFRIFGEFRAIAAALIAIHQEIYEMNATVSEIKQDLADNKTALTVLTTKVTGLETLTNTIKSQLDALIATGQPSVADLNAIRDGLVATKAQIQATADSVDATVAADTPAPAPAPTEPAPPTA